MTMMDWGICQLQNFIPQEMNKKEATMTFEEMQDVENWKEQEKDDKVIDNQGQIAYNQCRRVRNGRS